MNLAATPWNEKEGYETMLIIKYERIDFFYSRIYTEDKKQNHTKEDLKKAFCISVERMIPAFKLMIRLSFGIVW